jgi:hypothetical protein
VRTAFSSTDQLQHIAQGALISEMPVGLFGRVLVEMALIEARVRRLLLEPGFEFGSAPGNAVVCSLIDHAGDIARRRLKKR